MSPTTPPDPGATRRVSCPGSRKNRKRQHTGPSFHITRLSRLALGLVVGISLTLAACQGDDGGGGGPIVPDDPDTGPTDIQGDDTQTIDEDGSSVDSDAGDVQGDTGEEGDGTTPPQDCDGVTCEEGEVCASGECKTPAKARCDNADGEGQLTLGSTLNFSGSFPVQTSSVLRTECATGEDGQEMVFQFDVASDSQISATIDESNDLDTRIEFRRGGCAPGSDGGSFDRQICTDTDNSFFAPANSTWYMIVENNTGTEGTFDVQLDAQESCSFGGVGTITCEQNSVAICEEDTSGNPVETFIDCPDQCANGQCVGDSCTNPITRSVSSGFSETFSGELSAFTPQINLEPENSCRVNGQQYNASGPEVVFKLDGVQQGDTITVETTQSATGDVNSNVVYVSNNCPQSQTADQFICAATWDEIDSTNSTTVGQTGTYYVIVDKGTTTANPFSYEISVN